ncbi:DUF4974 domain-containing protein [Pedobacter sp. BS3]|uniref:FecR family protein n=1 Tax=Pedobacter sp. BS3 TaxID=2567937 RepID=UPI0011EED140|nr:FecR domain-containing protein [Pedobacter sp. BS3]TZF83882.1 DUF4974 domain-containing protein [Pedobacter sp. BS3]
MDEIRFKDLLIKYVNGTCNDAERRIVEKYIKEDRFREVLSEFLDEDWIHFDSYDNPANQDFYLKFKDKYQLPDEYTGKRSGLRFIRLLKYAAVLIIILSVGQLMNNYLRSGHSKHIEYITKYNPNGQRSIITLSDSSIVYLGSGSKIVYPAVFDEHKRVVKLNGEAFFEVKHNPAKAFIIESGDIQTAVLGTTFKVRAFDNENRTTVSVATGKVQVSQLQAGQTRVLGLLTPGEQIQWNAETGTAQKTEIRTTDLQKWKQGELVFRNVRMDSLCKELERNYNVQIVFANPRIAAYRISASFEQISITDVMKILGNTAGINYQINNGIITLTHKSK